MNSQNVWSKQAYLNQGDPMTLSTLVRGVIPALLVLLLLSAGPAVAEIIPGNRTAPWQGNIGVHGGIPNRTTIYKNIVTDLGADPTGVHDCTAIIQNAIANCPADQVVYMPAGTFRLA